MPDIEAEVFVHAVAQDVFKTEDEPDKTLAIAAEWFQSKWEMRRVGYAQHPRLEYVFLAGEYTDSGIDSGGYTIKNVGMSGVTVVGDDEADLAAMFPSPLLFTVVGRYHWTPVDAILDHTITIEVMAKPGSAKRVNNARVQQPFDPPPPSTIEGHQPDGFMPPVFAIEINPVFLAPTDAVVAIDVDGVRAAELPLNVVGIVGPPPFVLR